MHVVAVIAVGGGAGVVVDVGVVLQMWFVVVVVHLRRTSACRVQVVGGCVGRAVLGLLVVVLVRRVLVVVPWVGVGMVRVIVCGLVVVVSRVLVLDVL